MAGCHKLIHFPLRMGHKEILQGERNFPVGSRITLLDSTQSHTPQRANHGRHNDSIWLFSNCARQLPGPLKSNNDSRPPRCRETKMGRMLPISSYPPRNLVEPLPLCAGEGRGQHSVDHSWRGYEGCPQPD